MPRTSEDDRPEGLEWWVGQDRRRSVIRARLAEAAGSRGLRFAFYGRISTGDFQDRVSSGRWQRDFAADLVAGHGEIAVEFFDVCSRRVEWSQRPDAARLLAALADPDRGFDAIVVGEFERAFCGRQLLDLIPVFERYGVQLWLPELDGPVNFDDPIHHALLMLLGVHSRREVQRARYRVTAAMRAQAVEQGRHWAAVHRMATAWSMRVRIRTPRMPAGVGVCTSWNRTRPPPATCGGSSRGGWPDTASQRSSGA